MRWGVTLMGIGAAIALAASVPVGASAFVISPTPECAPEGSPVVMTGSVSASDAKTYRDLSFKVMPGTTRVEVGYRWDDVRPVPSTPASVLVQTVLDLGLWDQGGLGTPAGFRGWSGSRQGKTAMGQPPIWVQADTAERGYRPGAVQAGTWNVDLGIAAVAPSGATYEVLVRCLDPIVGPALVAQPVDPTHVANTAAGWYHGDFHMHGYHSSPSAPNWENTLDANGNVVKKGFVGFARDAGLDFLPVTDYVTDQHQRELGPVQQANPDLLIWPGREIITYFGHATVFGETSSVVDWRHGAPGVSLGQLQAKTVADGALFGVAHPTIFPTPIFGSFCRGCEFTLQDDIDWDEVATLEVLTGPMLVDDKQIGGPGMGRQIQNPFVATAIDLWERQLAAGHKITAVSGSDDKLGPGLGSSATAVHATELSRAALIEAVRAGHAYVRTLGVHKSPSVEMTAATFDGQHGMFGDTLRGDVALITVHVVGGAGQTILISADGKPAGAVPIVTNDFTVTFPAARSPLSGSLGTFWRIDTQAAPTATTGSYLSTIGNPVFLVAE